jgi:predicted Zn-dependent protease
MPSPATRLAAHDASGALEAYQKLAKLVPQSAGYQDEVGFHLAATNRTTSAIPYLQRATELDPKMAPAWYHLGAALWLTPQADPAIRACERQSNSRLEIANTVPASARPTTIPAAHTCSRIATRRHAMLFGAF